MSTYNRITEIEKQLILSQTLPAKEIATVTGRHKNTIYKWASEMGVSLPSSPRQYNVPYDLFDRLSPDTAYLLGFIAADGCILLSKTGGTIEISLSIKDLTHLKKIKKLFRTTSVIHEGNTNFNTRRVRLNICCRPLVNKVMEIGIPPRKSSVLTFPNIPDELASHFVRGYFDGDGCIRKTGDAAEISLLGTEQFLTSIKLIFNKVNGISVGSLKPAGNQYRLAYGGKYTPQQFGKWMYSDSSPSNRMTRKYCRFKQWLANKRFLCRYKREIVRSNRHQSKD